MKLRQAQASATYLLPDPGELDQRIVIRRRVDVPADDFGVSPTYPEETHYFTIRFRRGITADHEVVHEDISYRVKRVRDLNSKRRFLLLECEELGTDSGSDYAADSIFTR